MRLTIVVGACAAAVVGGCGIDRPPAPGRTEPAGGGAGETPTRSGGRFTCRTDRGEDLPLVLRTFSTRVTTRPGTVRSHVTIELAGPSGERAEAFIRLAVPPGAAVTAAVLWVNGRPMNGAFVERERARAIYESIVRRRRDPALVSWDGPGWVAVSIFPLERGEPRRFEIEWVEPAAVEAGVIRYRVPTIVEMGRLVGRSSVVVDGRPLQATGGDIVGLTPDPAHGAPIAAGRAPGDPFHRLLVRAATPVERAPRVVIVAETSQAMQAERAAQRRALATLLAALPADAKVTLTAADWDISTLADAVDPAEARRALSKLDAIVSAGALHLERALSGAVTRARVAGTTAVVFVGRGQDGFGGDGLGTPLRQLRDAGIRLSVVATADAPAPLADAAALTGGQTVAARDLSDNLGELAAAFRPRSARPALTARGSDEWRALETVTGQTVWVARALDAPEPPAGSAVAEVDTADLLPLWDRARLAWSGPGGRRAGDWMTASALTPLRSLLVLETEQDYARYDLAAAEPLAVGRRKQEEGKMGSKMGSKVGEGAGTGEATIGLSNASLLGLLSGPDARAAAYGIAGAVRRRATAARDVVLGQAEVRGRLDKEIVRRIVRRHLNELRFCYESEVTRNAGLGGQVIVQFTISASGAVINSMLGNSSLRNPRAETCIVQAVRHWEFPYPPGGGLVTVSYPFVFTGEGTLSDAEARAPVPPGEPDQASLDALAILSESGPVAERVRRIAALLGLEPTSEPENVAWMIDRPRASLSQLVLVARLLDTANRRHDAVRILSERAAAAPVTIAAQLRTMGAEPDASEVLALDRRPR